MKVSSMREELSYFLAIGDVRLECQGEVGKIIDIVLYDKTFSIITKIRLNNHLHKLATSVKRY